MPFTTKRQNELDLAGDVMFGIENGSAKNSVKFRTKSERMFGDLG
jgi:hypothetical protein